MSDIGNIRGGQPLSPTDGVQRTGQTDSSAPAGGVSTTPPPIDAAVVASATPTLAPPRLTAAEANERFLDIMNRGGVAGGSDDRSDFSDLMLKMQAMQQTLAEEQTKSQANQLDGARKKIEQNTKDQLAAIQREKEAMEKKDTWGIFGKIFSVVAIVVSAAAAVATGGLAGPLLALAIVAVGALQEIPGAAEAVFGKDAAPWVMLGLSVALAVAGGVQAWRTVGTQAMKVATTVAQAGVTAAQSTTTIGNAVAGYDVSKAQANLADVQSKNLALKKTQEDIMDELKKLLEEMQSGVAIVTDILKSQDDSRMQQIMKS